MTGKRILRFLTILVLAGIVMASHASADFTLKDEEKLGRETYQQLQKGNALLKIDRINDYINLIGNRILANSEKQPYPYHFSVIRSSAVNAFATPGGYVYVNVGLITLAENESELAGVMAHEIAHVNARHIADTIEKSKRVNIATLAGILAGVVLGGGGNLTAGLMTMSLAAGTTMSLKYSRDNEEEADRLGMDYMVKSGYAPRAMVDFMKIMRRYEFYSSNIPSYFLTHPGTDERIRYMDAAIQTTHKDQGSKEIIGGFKRIKTILIMISSSTPEIKRNKFQEDLKKNPQDVDDLYGLAVTEALAGQNELALKYFHQALALAPRDPDVLGDTGITYFRAGKTDESLKYLTEAMQYNSTDPEVLLYLGKAYEAKGDLPNAIDALKKLEQKRDADDEFIYNLAMIYGKANNKLESHYYFGVFFKKKKKTESALFHFKAALENVSPGSPRVEDIRKQIDEIQKAKAAGVQEQMKKRRR